MSTMNLTRKAPTPIRSTPSSAPLEAMVAKQQAHIDELVMRNRTTEQTIQKLKAEIEAEKHRHENGLQQLRQQFGEERTEWKEAADSLQNLWRISYLRAVHDLGKERMEIVKLKEELRLSRLARLQRDYQIGMFQAKEMELEGHVVDLQNQLEDAQWTYEQERSKRTALKVQYQEALDEVEEVRAERNQLEKSLVGLRSEHTGLLASSGAGSVSLERANLQIEGLRSSIAELQDKHNEVERTNVDLLRQLEKWRNLEKRENEEGDNLRKQKVELEVEVKELKDEIEQLRTVTHERDEKYQNRVQKYKDSLKEHGDAIKERDDELEQKEGEIEELKKKLLDITDEMKVLGAQLDDERKNAQQFKKQEFAGSKSAAKSSHDSPFSRPKPKPVITTKKPRISSTSDESEAEQRAKPTKKPMKAAENYDEDIVEVGKPEPKKTKKVSPSEGVQAKVVPKKSRKRQSSTPEIEIVESQPGSSSRPGKRKASNIIVDDDEAPQKKTKKPPTASSRPAPKPKAGPTKAKAREKPVRSESDSEAEPVQKKKKRKINIGNIFPSAQASTFDWGPMSQADGGLNIPTELSPVKESSTMAPRTLSKAFGSIAGRR
ncbi:hypothetical protein BDY19DRAFT_697479 [Irpex rosettiformis]|uniref:Uncharacterized protein n=1 Tax=Irpex rosettiformis TaxID=378272 RepID=A0ACB8UAP8_9APHY|nr:hypothetical protein BDY19DRAFT_697479 [Irpex rosettiformis]